MNLSQKHPRYSSLVTREKMVKAVENGIAVPQGLIAHGRGEAFDYLLGERTLPSSSLATSAAAALLLKARHPVVSVNGNALALVGKEIVSLSSLIPAPIEINLFHRTLPRERAIAARLRILGAENVLGIGSAASDSIFGVSSARKQIDPRGIGSADVVLVPLEDGDRSTALREAGKEVIAVDLNPLSRTSQAASISIVDNIIRAIPELIKACNAMRKLSRLQLARIASEFDNQRNLTRGIEEINRYLRGWITN